MTDMVGQVLIIIGLTFNLIGCIGLVRMPDIYNRLHATTKCVTLGTSAVLLGVFAINGLNAAGIKALICIAFILSTSPVASHAISRAAHRSGVKLVKGSVVDKYSEVDNNITVTEPEA